MAVEILDKGSCKATGFITTNAASPVSRSQGIASIQASGVAGVTQVNLLEPIAATELLCLGGVLTAAPPAIAGNRTVQFRSVSDSVVQIETYGSAGALEELECWFAFFRLEGGQPEVIPAVP